ncbi:flavin adenine dinucleotide transporter FLX1 Ecym_5393 [Eremothecium cymbalariae DBVPG|uniref:Uncharacterized protein n=1 Tax=Eremothecium cymbalariae (strain CBS 270.75 / DBVPG 7215 / KCTC 17166 / NRRL Y-17582) TaxID=931890 RepID=I6NDK6_ERECY|nr:hypothetical protein Ecym_5393 [Eremothecium cymbalariae DBVPG\
MGHVLGDLQKEVISGLSAGLLATIISHPLDLVKVRLQLSVRHTPRVTYSQVLNDMLRNTYWVREIYRGLGISLLGNSLAWAIYFGLYRFAKDVAISNVSVSSSASDSELKDRKLSAPVYLAAAGFSGTFTALLTNPIWVIKTRIMSTTTSGPYKSTIDGASKLLCEEGILAFWKGLLPSLFGVSQGAIYFTVYDTLKFQYLHSSYDKHERKLSALELITVSCISKMISLSAVYPLQLLKSNLQDFKATSDIMTLGSLIYQKEGIAGFYKGVFANLLRSIPASCITFFVYENVKHSI